MLYSDSRKTRWHITRGVQANIAGSISRGDVDGSYRRNAGFCGGSRRGQPRRGELTISAPLVAGNEVLRPIVDAYLDLYHRVRVRLLLSDRVSHLLDENIDAALRIAQLPDSPLMAQRVGVVRTVICASPDYLERAPPANVLGDIKRHQVIALAETRHADHWTFGIGNARRRIKIEPRLSVSSVDGARASALAGHGLVRLMSYQVARAVRDGRLVILFDRYEPAPLPVHLIAPKIRLAAPKTRAFFTFATVRLEAAFQDLALSHEVQPKSSPGP
jgi:DNA-binding transcriptional LysR family regulator